MNRRKRQLAYLTVPVILMVLAFIAIPLVNAIRISFYRWNGYSQSMKWIGLDNYQKIFTDKKFAIAFRNTMIYGFGSTLFQNIFGLLAALYVNRKFKGRNFMRVILYMPIMISGFLMGRILYFCVQYDGGVWNELLGLLGIDPIYWTGNGIGATLVCTAINIWQYMGLCMLIYLSGLQGISTSYREAAQLDGCNSVQEFFYVVFPLLIPAITTAVVTNLIGGFKLFDVVAALTMGGPNGGSASLSYFISDLYFQQEKAGYSSAVGVALFVIIMVIAWPINYLLRKKEVQY